MIVNRVILLTMYQRKVDVDMLNDVVLALLLLLLLLFSQQKHSLTRSHQFH